MHLQSKHNVIKDLKWNGKEEKTTDCEIDSLFYASVDIWTLVHAWMSRNTPWFENGKYLSEWANGNENWRFRVGYKTGVQRLEKANNVWNTQLHCTINCIRSSGALLRSRYLVKWSYLLCSSFRATTLRNYIGKDNIQENKKLRLYVSCNSYLI